MRTLVGLSILFLALISACNSTSEQEFQQINEALTVDELEEIFIDIRAGELLIQSASDASFQITGQVAAPETLNIFSDGKSLKIFHENSTASDQLIISIPANINLKIYTFSANSTLKDFSGDLEVRSTGGSILLENLVGSAQIWLGRGDVTMLGGFGEAVIIGEHGELYVRNFSGDLSMSTIMGSIEYDAPMEMDNIVRLETDHGPVSASLPGDARADVIVTSTSGTVNCAGKDLSQTFNGCTGILGDGKGEFSIRTVSGGVKLTVDQGQGD